MKLTSSVNSVYPVQSLYKLGTTEYITIDLALFVGAGTVPWNRENKCVEEGIDPIDFHAHVKYPSILHCAGPLGHDSSTHIWERSTIRIQVWDIWSGYQTSGTGKYRLRSAILGDSEQTPSRIAADCPCESAAASFTYQWLMFI